MESIIQLLPEVIANQIAAGEVVQRPASVVKELMENAIDAGASKVDVYVKDAGKSLIQVSDNGCGMSAADARMCFERHATSKIREQADLFRIRTMGFRGEALASIAAVAQVRLRSRLHEEELGTEIEIEGGMLKHCEPCTCSPGSSFSIKNLFYNVPARRNFLKRNPVEARHILQEFIRIALPHPAIAFSLKHNETEVYKLPAGEHDTVMLNLAKRIGGLFKKDVKDKLIPLHEDSEYVRIWGYIGKPSLLRKNRNDQFFFVNLRYIKSHYLNHAISQAYEEVIPKGSHPFYCIFLDIDPRHVDVNIHPTKTEVKFDDERTLYALLRGQVKRALGELHPLPETDQVDQQIKEAIYTSHPGQRDVTIGDLRVPKKQKMRPADWDQLYQPPTPSAPVDFDPPQEKQADLPSLFPKEAAASSKRPQPPQALAQLGAAYILADQHGKLLLVDQYRAQQRILYERFLATRSGSNLPSQQLLFPQSFEYDPVAWSALWEAGEIMGKMGFEIKDFGKNSLIVYGAPAGLPAGKVREVLDQIVHDVQQSGQSRAYEKTFETTAKAVAVRTAIPHGKELTLAEMQQVLQELFACEAPAYTPSGKAVFQRIEPDTFFTD